MEPDVRRIKHLLTEACTEIARLKIENKKLKEQIEAMREEMFILNKGVVKLPFAGTVK